MTTKYSEIETFNRLRRSSYATIDTELYEAYRGTSFQSYVDYMCAKDTLSWVLADRDSILEKHNWTKEEFINYGEGLPWYCRRHV